MAYSAPSNRSTGDIISAAIWNQDVVANMIAMTPHGVSVVIDGGGAVITAGIKMDVEVPAKCSITANSLLADQSGSIVIDIWKDTFANAPPTVADTITASAKPTITTATKSTDSTLTGWTKALAVGDILRINVDSATTITRCTLALRVSYD